MSSLQFSHHFQYPPNTEVVYSYFESRGGKFPAVCFFGLQYIIKVESMCVSVYVWSMCCLLEKGGAGAIAQQLLGICSYISCDVLPIYIYTST